ncbi:MAG: DUF4338 domain-containing protein [Desulfobacterales bacterium]|jgi:hypothetical protein
MIRYCGRDFSKQELVVIRQLISENPSATRAVLSRLTCQALHWYKIDGGLKEMSCRVAMLRMQDDGLIKLPAARHRHCPANNVQFTSATDPKPKIKKPVDALPCVQLQIVMGRQQSRLWNEYIHRYHYLGYKPLPGAQLRYFVISGNDIIALLGFGASAWQCAPRDKYIGWTHDQRKKKLQYIVNNARFLILPWVKCKNLASKILSLASHRLSRDWQDHYGYQPVLLETFVERDRFAGTCYKAANWVLVGQTKGRGKLGPAGKISVPIKDLWLYPLERNFRHELTS